MGKCLCDNNIVLRTNKLTNWKKAKRANKWFFLKKMVAQLEIDKKKERGGRQKAKLSGWLLSANKCFFLKKMVAQLEINKKKKEAEAKRQNCLGDFYDSMLRCV